MKHQSKELRLLKDEGLVKSRRDGKNIFYSLDDQHVIDIIDIAFTHIEHKSHGENCCCNSCCSSCAGGRDPHHE